MPLLFTLPLPMLEDVFYMCLPSSILFQEVDIIWNIRNAVDQFKVCARATCWFVVYCFYGQIYRMTPNETDVFVILALMLLSFELELCNDKLF